MVDDRYQILNRVLENNRNIKDNISNSILVVSSGALVLSFSFIQYFSYSSETVLFLKISWLLLFFTIISNILSRYFLSEIIRIEINKKDFEFQNPEGARKLFEQFEPEWKVSLLYRIFIFLHWTTFISGLAGLLVFAWLNV